MRKQILDESFGYADLEKACSILGVSKSWLYKATSACIIPHFKVGGKLMFKVEELLKFIEMHRVKTIL